MLNIIPLAALNDNYIWLIENGQQAVCIDPGDAVPVIDYLCAHNLTLVQIWITHAHADHTAGVLQLKQAFPRCRVFGNSDIAQVDEIVGEGATIKFSDGLAEVWAIPGHTATHLGYLWRPNDGSLHVFCGDTLFSAGCGRVFTGTMTQLFTSLQRFNQLPNNTFFYPAHEYTATNLNFAAHIEPENKDVEAAAANAFNTPTLPVTLAHERRINPFLRTSYMLVINRTEELCGKQLKSEEAVFTTLRELKNQF